MSGTPYRFGVRNRLTELRRYWGEPDAERAQSMYRDHAPDYDQSCQRSWPIRIAAIESLRLSPGETAFDVACGTGLTLVELARRVGPGGRAIGIECSPEMAALAGAKVQRFKDCAEVRQSTIEAFDFAGRADAMLFCYTHDVLQSEAAIANLVRHARPGCRVAIAGNCFQPWLYGWPVNLFTAWRARGYLTTFKGLRDPTHRLRLAGATLTRVRYAHLGSSYLAVGVIDQGPMRGRPSGPST